MQTTEDPAALERAEKEAKKAEHDLDWILSKSEGRRWLYNLLMTHCHLRSPSHVPGDVHSTAFNEGARAVGLAVEAEIRSRMDKYLVMIKENETDG